MDEWFWLYRRWLWWLFVWLACCWEEIRNSLGSLVALTFKGRAPANQSLFEPLGSSVVDEGQSIL